MIALGADFENGERVWLAPDGSLRADVGPGTLALCERAYDAAYRCARGAYQRALCSGREAVSGSSLAGKAKRFSDVYRRSAAAWLARCEAAGVVVREARGLRGARVVVIVGLRADLERAAGLASAPAEHP